MLPLNIIYIYNEFSISFLNNNCIRVIPNQNREMLRNKMCANTPAYSTSPVLPTGEENIFAMPILVEIRNHVESENLLTAKILFSQHILSFVPELHTSNMETFAYSVTGY